MGVTPDCVEAVVQASGGKFTDAEAAELIRYTEALRRGAEAAGNVDALDARVRQLAADQAERAQIAAALAKKHAALSAIAYSRGLAELNALVASGLDRRKAVLAFLEGSARNVEGARDSVARLALAYRSRFLAPLNEILVRDAEVRRLVESGDRQFADNVVREMRELREGGKPGSSGDQAAARLAKVYGDVAEAARQDLNRLGFPIGRLDGWSPQAHDSARVVKVSPEEWADFILPRLDRDKTFPGVPEELVRVTLRDIYDSIITGVDRNGSVAGETGRVGPANLANSLARARVLHFRDADGWLQYRERFGTGHIHDAMFAHLAAAAKAAAQVQKLGPNPEVTLTRLRAELQRQAATDPQLTPQQRQRAAAALDPRNVQGTIGSAWAEVSGLTAVPVSVRAAHIGTGLRAWQSLSKLMGAVLSSVPGDLVVRGAALTFEGKPILASARDELLELLRGRGSTAEQRAIAAQLDAGLDGVHGHIAQAFVEDAPVGRWHKALALGFRLSGLTWWQDAMKAGAARMLSRWMADNADKGFDALGVRYRTVLRQQGIGAAEWDAIRATRWTGDDGNAYITPDRLAGLPRQVLARLAKDRLEAMQRGMAERIAAREARNAQEADWVAKRTTRFREGLARDREAWTRRSQQRAEGADRKVDRIRDSIAEVELRLSELAEFHDAVARGEAWPEAEQFGPPRPPTPADRNINPETGERRRPFEGAALDYMDAPPADRARRAEGEARARLDRLRRSIGEVRRATKGRDVEAAEAFELQWNRREAELLAFADQMADRAQRRQVATETERAEWGDRVDAALADTRRELELKLRGFFADEMGSAVLEGDVQARRQLIRGTQAGTFNGELLRAIAQFKTFPVTFTNRVLGRAFLGYSPAERMLQGRNLGVMLAGLLVSGYVSTILKDLVRGYEPADPTERKTWLRAFAQSGGLGIYGDFLFGQANRFGNSALETVAGPLLGTAASGINLLTKARDGEAKAGEWLNLALQNSPFINLWYARPVLDFLVLNALREAGSPGFLRRQEQQRRKDYGQERLTPPTLFDF